MRRWFWHGLLVTSILMMLGGVSQPILAATDSVLYVAPSGQDVFSCGTIASPCRTIQYAVNKAPYGASIKVAEGTYTYDASVDACTFLVTRAVVCLVDKHLTLLGGYTTSNWSQADPVGHPAIIDGGGLRRGVAIIAYNSTAYLTMEGFIIQNGVAQGTSSGDEFHISAHGGGLWAQNSAASLRYVTFRNNAAIGGNTSQDHGGAGAGGGMAVESTTGGLITYLDHVTFENNQAIGGTGNVRGGHALGGGLFTYAATVHGNYVTFQGNQAFAGATGGSGQDASGTHSDALGGGASFQIGSTVVLTHVVATNNVAQGGNATSHGGGAYGGGLNAEHAQLTLTDVTLQGNTAQAGNALNGGYGFGGGFLLQDSDATINRVVAVGNVAQSGASTGSGYAGAPGGGGGYIAAVTTGHTTTISNGIFSDNQIVIGQPGTGIGGGGGGLTISGVTATLNHLTIAGNTFSGDIKSGLALLVQGSSGSSGIPGIAYLNYSIVANHVQPYTYNSSAVTVPQGSAIHFNRCMFSGNSNNTNQNGYPFPPGTITGLNTCTDVPDVGFVSPGAPAYDYHLRDTSPAIDQAVGSTIPEDIDGQPRPNGSAADLGADEFYVLSNTVYLPLVVR